MYEGFKCTTAAQTDTPDGKPACPDVEIRYLCLDGVVDIQGNIFTTFFDRESAGDDNDANRLQHFPKEGFSVLRRLLHFGFKVNGLV